MLGAGDDRDARAGWVVVGRADVGSRWCCWPARRPLCCVAAPSTGCERKNWGHNGFHSLCPQVTRSTDVIIVGAGPTGLALALDLQRRGIRFCLLEKLAAPMPFSKANTLMSRTLEELDRLGVIEEMFASGIALSAARIFRNDRQIAEFTVELTQTSMPFMLNLRQSRLEDILSRRLEAQGDAIERGWELQDVAQYETELSARFVHASGEQRTLRAQYLIGTDGAHSRVRRLMALPLMGTTYPETFLVADVHADLQLARNSTYCWLRPDGFLLGWPHREANDWHFVMNLTSARQDASLDITQLQDSGPRADRSRRREPLAIHPTPPRGG